MPSQIRHRRTHDPAITFAPTIGPGELAVNTANRQIIAGDADPASSGVVLPLLAVRVFDYRSKYAVGEYAVQGGYLYRCKVAHGPAIFFPANFEQIAGVDTIQQALADYLPLIGGTMSGALNLPIATPTANTQATNKKYVDDQITNVVLGNVSASTTSNIPSGNISSITVQAALNELDTEKVAIAGSVMTGQLGLPAAPAPTASQAVRKDYVDGVVAAIPIATSAEYLNNSQPSHIITTGAAWGAAATQPSVSDASGNITFDMNVGIDFFVTLTGTGRVVINPSNIKLGQRGVIYFTQDGTGGRTVTTWNSVWKFSGGIKPVMTPTAGAVDAVSYVVRQNNFILCSLLPDVK